MQHPSISFPARQRAAPWLAGLGLFCLAHVGPAAAAPDISVGVGAGVDRGRVDCVASFACDRSSSHAKLTGGYRLADAVELQTIFFASGKFKGGDTTPLGTEFGGSFKVRGLGLSAGYRWELAPKWQLTARAGAAAVRTRFDYENAAYGSASKTKLEPLVGVGIGYAISPQVTVGIDYDATRFKVHTEHGSLQMLGLAVRYSF